MKKTMYLLFICLMCFVSVANSQTAAKKNEKGRQITLMTYNLKFASPTYKPSWEVRRKMQVDMIRKYNPDVIGTQEGLKEQIDYLAEQLPEYTVVGEGRQGGDDDEHMAIFFKRSKFRLRELNSFALSKTPEILGSGPSVNPRIMTWARFAFINKLIDGEEEVHPSDYRDHWDNTQEFYVFNTHFFNGKSEGLERLNAAKLINEKIKPFNRFGEWTKERPLFLMGDFNALPSSDVYKEFVGNENLGGPNLFKDCKNGGEGTDFCEITNCEIRTHIFKYLRKNA